MFREVECVSVMMYLFIGNKEGMVPWCDETTDTEWDPRRRRRRMSREQHEEKAMGLKSCTF